MTRPPATEAVDLMKPRREISAGVVADMSGNLPVRRPGSHGGGTVNRLTNTWIGPAATDVAAHGRIDVGIGGLGVLLQQGNGRHDLAGLAVAALRHVDFHPGAL